MASSIKTVSEIYGEDGNSQLFAFYDEKYETVTLVVSSEIGLGVSISFITYQFRDFIKTMLEQIKDP